MGSGSDTHRMAMYFVYMEHGSLKGVHDQPCESTGLTERHSRMTTTQQIGHLKGKNDRRNKMFYPDNICAIPETCLYGHS